MTHPFAAAISPLAQRERTELLARAVDFWAEASRATTPEGRETLARRLRTLDPRLGLARVGGRFRVRALELSAWPIAELVVQGAAGLVEASVGLPPGDAAQALAVVNSRYGLSFEDARVRVGVTRGHLMAVVVEVPLDCNAGDETLQLAAETYVEVCLGDDVSDQWLVSIDVVRAARQQSLLRVMDSRRPAETFPLPDLPVLIERAKAAILEQCPLTFGGDSALWTALELGSATTGTQEAGAQWERRYASTSCPEALKAALEGLPFDSRRFCQGGQLFFWVAFRAPDQARSSLKRQAEELFSGDEVDGLACALVGTGFGDEWDYLDLWAPAQPDHLGRLVGRLSARLGAELLVGFYDSRLSGEQLLIEPGVEDSSRLLNTFHS